MNLFSVVFVFLIGSVMGFFIEVVFRKLFSKNNLSHKWVNPGFCKGPYLPIYGITSSLFYTVSVYETDILVYPFIIRKIFVALIILVSVSALEFFSGFFIKKFFGIRLWDYSGEKRNIDGMICPKFSVIWTLLGMTYNIFLHHVLKKTSDILFGSEYFVIITWVFFALIIADFIYSSKKRISQRARTLGIFSPHERQKVIFLKRK